MRKVPLTQGKVALVDDDKYEELTEHKWYAQRGDYTYYAYRHKYRDDGHRSVIGMHRQIMNAEPDQQIDHKNQNGLDNCIKNLRFCSNAQNQQNGRTRGGSSKYKGVHWNKQDQKWNAMIKTNSKRIFLGCYDSETQAAKVYDAAAIKYFGEFANPNFK